MSAISSNISPFSQQEDILMYPSSFFACSAVLDRVFDKGLQRQGGDKKIGIFYIEDNVQIFFAADVFKVRKHPYVIQFFFERYKIGSRSFDLHAQMF